MKRTPTDFIRGLAWPKAVLNAPKWKNRLEVALCRRLQLGDVQDAQDCYWQSFPCCCHMEVRVWQKPQRLSLFKGTWSTPWHCSHQLKAGTLQSQASVHIMNDYLEDIPPPYWTEEKHIDMKRRSDKRSSLRGNWDAYIDVEERWYMCYWCTNSNRIGSKFQKPV